MIIVLFAVGTDDRTPGPHPYWPWGHEQHPSVRCCSLWGVIRARLVLEIDAISVDGGRRRQKQTIHAVDCRECEAVFTIKTVVKYE
jgi:arginyl-tRNA--protein-N-Asp/Glu arginylyltransferase